MTSASDVLQMIKDNDVKFVDLRLTDTLGKEMHVTVPADCIDEDVFELGQPFDGSSFIGWRGQHPHSPVQRARTQDWQGL